LTNLLSLNTKLDFIKMPVIVYEHICNFKKLMSNHVLIVLKLLLF